jgi:predicted transcriptional regulator
MKIDNKTYRVIPEELYQKLVKDAESLQSNLIMCTVHYGEQRKIYTNDEMIKELNEINKTKCHDYEVDIRMLKDKIEILTKRNEELEQSKKEVINKPKSLFKQFLVKVLGSKNK